MRTHIVFLIITASACGGEFTKEYFSSSETALGGGCEPALVPPVDTAEYIPGSAAGRDFLIPQNHLGEDIALTEGTEVRAMGNGQIVVYRSANGYGELTVVIEHELDDTYAFENGGNTIFWTRHLLSIYGHLRNARQRGGSPLAWQTGDWVQQGEVIGYVNDDTHNGDGAEHLHLGIRLSGASAAQARDPFAWFRGYDTATGTYRSDFAAASQVIAVINEACGATSTPTPSEEPAEEPLPEPDVIEDLFSMEWITPDRLPASRITLSGRIMSRNRVWGEWREWEETQNTNRIATSFALGACQGVDFSVEVLGNSGLNWSCMGSERMNGFTTARWNTSHLFPIAVPNGLGGCNLRLGTPCSQPPAPSTPEPVTPTTDPIQEPIDVSNQTISCRSRGSLLDVTVRGMLNNSTLVNGALESVGFLSLGSDETGWNTSTTPPEHFAIWNGQSYPHTITVPGSVDRFNLWAAGPAGARWFNLRAWNAINANCHITDDGRGGLVIER